VSRVRLRFYEKTVLRKIFGPEGEAQKGPGENGTAKSFAGYIAGKCMRDFCCTRWFKYDRDKL
jgi:hypothetical protein